MRIDWNAQHIVLTGATGGLGQALAEQLSALGARLTLIGRNEQALKAFAKRLEQDYLVADITQPEQRQRVVAHVRAQATTLPVTGLINNAGMAAEGMLSQQAEHAEAMLATNLLAPILLINELLPELKHRASFILNVGSVFGSIGFPGQTLYCASKFGLKGFTEALRRELSDTLVRVMYVGPRAIKTGFNGPLMQALNAQTKTHEDEPPNVAQQIIQQIEKGQVSRLIGFPEKLFAVLNGIKPSWLDGEMFKINRKLKSLIKE
ncbi:MAG TPA: short chain dehydrogenase [Idiomarina baltica]|jgi:short-subunit dehydrogenase|uniref:Short chain dehydrogenase n=1 Tax=Idiomarina baltica TaxID=190892 RepID=A0A348WPW0_9GAMM|nr:SDR family oxidoreductase [Pseudomonadota bacterium]HAE90851.1 short chain dehydrogenase [Idiomarina sp.]HAR56572.1 short chain dehydrogenase [Idiomarina baltica]|tara:strand:- start:2334 stop:3122 length:789 start_codon:yes stop_codon:yes gene_type:complete